jgi:acyl-CoA reductase-like NAD-dependent aldehyde dehydrogenase
MDVTRLRDRLTDTVQALQRQRVELVNETQTRVAAIDARIAAAQQLAARWDTLTITEAAALLEQAGVQLEVR